MAKKINWTEHNYSNTQSFSLQNLECYCRVVKIYDGDTITVIIHVFNCFYKFSVRLLGIDTCEIKSNNEVNKTLAIKARKRLFELISNVDTNDTNYTNIDIDKYLSDNVCLVYIKCNEFDKYGRILCDIYKNEDKERTFSEILLDEKLAYSYDGKKKLSEEEQLELLSKS
jgi:endonuclease YncB( thermonuclease family)